MREFVAEQYLPAADADEAVQLAGAARRAAEQLTSEGTRVEFARSIFIPADETCIYLYRAESIEAVKLAAARASLRLERVAEAVPADGAEAVEDAGRGKPHDRAADQAKQHRHSKERQ